MITLLKLSRETRILAGLVFAVSLLCGQGIDSILVGTVTDPSGAGILASQVIATNRDTGVRYSAATNGAGEYRIDHLPVGSYDVAAAAPSFAPRTLANVPLQLNRTAVANLSLELAAQAASVQVTEAAAPIDASSSQLQATFDARALIDVPAASLGSGFLNLSLLTGGVASSGGLGQGVGPSVAGQRPSGNRFYVEGVDNNSYFTTGPLTSVSNEALSEFTLLQNYYGSQFGGATGGIFDAVVKSGGNQIHGSLYEYMQNRNLDALDAAYARQGATSPPRYDNNRLGATFGGPIVKNKLFYFGSFEYNPVGYGSSPASVVYAPTAAGFQMLNSIPGLSQVNLGVLEKYTPAAPSATGSTTSIERHHSYWRAFHHLAQLFQYVPRRGQHRLGCQRPGPRARPLPLYQGFRNRHQQRRVACILRDSSGQHSPSFSFRIPYVFRRHAKRTPRRL